MNQPTPQQYVPTENAQLVFNYSFASPAPVYRFNNAKKARKVYEDAVKAWKKYDEWVQRGVGPAPTGLFEIKADMFDGVIDLRYVAAINFVEWPKRSKFLPQP